MSKPIIVIDPGHNKAVLPAKQSPDGSIKEYAWNWDMAVRLRDALIADGYDARLSITKEFSEDAKAKDYLTKRAAFANGICKAHGTANVLFVSIHINAAGSGAKWMGARGWSVFVAANKEGKFTASQGSKDLASRIYDAVESRGFAMRRHSPAYKYWPGNFTVLTATNCKAVLLENLFMDNKEDAALLKDEETKQKLVEAWKEGIDTFVQI